MKRISSKVRKARRTRRRDKPPQRQLGQITSPDERAESHMPMTGIGVLPPVCTRSHDSKPFLQNQAGLWFLHSDLPPPPEQ